MQDPKSGPVGSDSKTPWYLTRKTVIWAGVLFGPFGLPLLWFSPKFKSGTKVTLTVVAVLLTYASYRFLTVLMDYVETATVPGLTG